MSDPNKTPASVTTEHDDRAVQVRELAAPARLDQQFVAIVAALTCMDIRTLHDDVWLGWDGRPLSSEDCRLVGLARSDHFEAARELVLERQAADR